MKNFSLGLMQTSDRSFSNVKNRNFIQILKKTMKFGKICILELMGEKKKTKQL